MTNHIHRGLALALLGSLGTASAATGAPVHYRFDHEVRVPATTVGLDPVHAEEVLALRWRLDTTCDVQSAGRGQDLTCHVDKARLVSSDAHPQQDGMVLARTQLEASRVTARIGRDGSLSRLDVTLPDADPTPLVRLIVERSFAGLDLPQRDDDVWEQRDPALVPAPGSYGAVAHVRAVHWKDDAEPRIYSRGGVTWQPPGSTVDPNNIQTGEVEAVAELDSEGRVRYRRWSTRIGEDGFRETGTVRTLPTGDAG